MRSPLSALDWKKNPKSLVLEKSWRHNAERTWQDHMVNLYFRNIIPKPYLTISLSVIFKDREFWMQLWFCVCVCVCITETNNCRWPFNSTQTFFPSYRVFFFCLFLCKCEEPVAGTVFKYKHEDILSCFRTDAEQLLPHSLTELGETIDTTAVEHSHFIDK